jgi:hypothetical protein
MLKDLSGRELVAAQKKALNKAAGTLTRAAVRTFLADHPEGRSGKRGARSTAVPRDQFRLSGVAGGRRLAYRRLDKKKGMYIYWIPAYVLDWFEYGTRRRFARGKSRISRRKRAITLGGGGYNRGAIEAKPFIDKAARSVEKRVFANLGKDLAKFIYRIVQKRNS